MDAPGIPNSLTKLKPKTLAIIAVGGIGLGLVWRHLSGKSSAAVNPDGSLASDTSNLGLPGSSTGALAGSTSGDTGGVDTGTTRETGSISFPVVKWIITIDGVEYMTDGTNIWPIPAGANGKPTPTGPVYGPTGPFVPDGFVLNGNAIMPLPDTDDSTVQSTLHLSDEAVAELSDANYLAIFGHPR